MSSIVQKVVVSCREFLYNKGEVDYDFDQDTGEEKERLLPSHYRCLQGRREGEEADSQEGWIPFGAQKGIRRPNRPLQGSCQGNDRKEEEDRRDRERQAGLLHGCRLKLELQDGEHRDPEDPGPILPGLPLQEEEGRDED